MEGFDKNQIVAKQNKIKDLTINIWLSLFYFYKTCTQKLIII